MAELTNDEFFEVLLSAQHSLFRLELQPAYDEPSERQPLKNFLAGAPDDPITSPGMAEWLQQVRDWTSAGIQIGRVRVHEEPPTDYQRWERWLGRWNIEAGEQLRYMTRERAHEIGLLPAAGDVDWWLIDSNRLIEMYFDTGYRRVRNLYVENPTNVVRACAWRDLTVHYSTLEKLQATTKEFP